MLGILWDRRVKKLRQIDEFIWRKHALERMLERGIGRAEVIEAVQNGEVVEEYPNDFPYASCLIYNLANEPLHIVAALDGQRCFVITVYRPRLEEFESDYKTRKNR